MCSTVGGSILTPTVITIHEYQTWQLLFTIKVLFKICFVRMTEAIVPVSELKEAVATTEGVVVNSTRVINKFKGREETKVELSE